jgi:hypothetical protein
MDLELGRAVDVGVALNDRLVRCCVVPDAQLTCTREGAALAEEGRCEGLVAARIEPF